MGGKRKRDPRMANGHRRRQLRKWLAAQGGPCALCGGAIDYSLPAGHPLAFEVDEIVPVSRGGDPLDRSNVQPSHRICNERKGNRMAMPKMREAGKPKRPADPTSRRF
jgi:5-methylcytosine-specific restriction endonuclease McrA